MKDRMVDDATYIPLSYPNRKPPIHTTDPSQYARRLPIAVPVFIWNAEEPSVEIESLLEVEDDLREIRGRSKGSASTTGMVM
jgi:hypothetical protein